LKNEENMNFFLEQYLGLKNEEKMNFFLSNIRV